MLPFVARGLLGFCLAASVGIAEHRGRVTFLGLPVPGATVTATGTLGKVVAISGRDGGYSLPELVDGEWRVTVEMFGFTPLEREIRVQRDAAPASWDLQMLPLARIKAAIQRPPAPPTVSAARQEAPPAEDEMKEQAADGFLINGSMNNGAASPFGQVAAFGNNRNPNPLYNGGFGLIAANSTFDARPFSLTGQDTPKASYARVTGVVTLGGPLRIPSLFENGPFFFVGYQWTRNNAATNASALMPDSAARSAMEMNPQARALLALYPLPNFTGSTRYNYQIPILNPTHQDSMQSRLNKTLGTRDQVYGGFGFQSTRSDNSNVFGFLDKSSVLGVDANANWSHRVEQGLFLNVGFQFSRLASRVRSNFEGRVNVSSLAGIAGNAQNPMNWGPPALQFASGIAGLSDVQSSFNRNQSAGISYSMSWSRRAHNITWGADFRRQEFNYLTQQDPRGTFTFTGTEDFAKFVAGTPDASSIAFGNADKYFRESAYDAYITDDWRLSSSVTLNAGARWEYGAPITELYDRLVNLDIGAGFAAATPVLANDGRYPRSLVRPDRNGFAPRIGLAWRPVAGSSLVVRAGYGFYYDTSVYQNIALRMAQQPPLSKTVRVQNSPSTPLTLADGFPAAASSNTFGIDPDFRIGYAQNWRLSVQRDLPWSLQMIATHLGIKGTRGIQQFLPNTFPIGAPGCVECPVGFAYLTSTGNSTRNSGELQLRRRLRSGLTATVQYTYSKSIDDVGSGIAQNWLDLRGDRGLSDFDQRHLLRFDLRYTTGMGFGGGSLLSGWRGGLFKDWAIATSITAGTGLRETPVYLATVPGTGFTGTIRPHYTGASLYSAPDGLFLNPAAYAAPLPGQWGNTARNSITGPGTFSLNASLGRTFRVGDRLNADTRLDSSNVLNRVNYSAWNTTVNSAQFGVPASASAMRTMQLTLRVRF